MKPILSSPAARAHTMRPGTISRSAFLRLGAGIGATLAFVRPAMTQTNTNTIPEASRKIMNTGPIPSSDEALPVIGCGTWIGFDVAPGSAERERLPTVLGVLFGVASGNGKNSAKVINVGLRDSTYVLDGLMHFLDSGSPRESVTSATRSSTPRKAMRRWTRSHG